MRDRSLPPTFAATLFLSAFLIFAVQPMTSKMLLPLLGGSPSVWNTAMVFFQAMLLAGYAYAHFIAKYLSLKAQAALHLVLLCAFTLLLPLALPSDTMPPAEGNLAIWQLGVMLACIGGPFFILAASAPLFQHWFASSGHKDAQNPYFLYAVSNIGSMMALISYPVIFEPLMTLHEVARVWFAGYAALGALVLACGILVRNGVKPVINADSTHVTGRARVAWIVLSFVPSSLMLGVTTMITTDLASTPLFWIIPLALYLGTFIIAFANKPIIGVAVTRELTAYTLCIVILLFMLSGFIVLKTPMIAVHLLAFFLCALLCHSELAQSKPSATHLTEFFLTISFGGVLGGIFNALIAPQIFTSPLEYPISLAVVGFIIWSNQSGRLNISLAAAGVVLCLGTYLIKDNFIQTIGCIAIFVFLLAIVQKRGAFAVTCLAALLCFQSSIWSSDKTLIARDRNYFGTIKVFEQNGIHFFYHGTTIHGAQFQNDKDRLTPLTYYSPDGPAKDIFDQLARRKGQQSVGAIGLGVGSIACYKAPGRHFDFYEIDKDVVKFAQDTRYFSYLSECNSPYDIILGDGRLKIAQADKKYDLIYLDAFSSDNIPVHLMTKEAFAIYLSKLKPDGFIAMNISNRFLDLRPVLTAIANNIGVTVYFKVSRPVSKKDDVSELYTNSVYAVMIPNHEPAASFNKKAGWIPPQQARTARPWTDDYANIIASFIFLQ